MIPWYGRGIAYAKKSLSIRKKLLDQWGQGQSASFYGAVLYAASQYEKAIEKCNQAIPLLEQMGDRWEANTAKWHMAYSLYRLGNLKEALNLATKLYQDAIHIGDYTAAGIALSIWAKASEGNIKAEYIQKEFDRNFDDAHTRAELMQANGVRLIYANDPFKAGQVLEEAYLLVKKSGLRQEYVAPILPWLTTALRLSSEALDPLSIERSHILKKADYYAKKGLKLANHYKNNLPHMLREAAYIAAWKRKSNLARKYIQKSSDIAFRQQARYEYALTLAAKGRIGKAFGWQSFNDDLLIAKQILQPIEDSIRDKKVAPIKPTLSLIARFNSLLEGGRSLVTALSEQDIWKYLEISTRKLFHGDKFLLIKASASGYQILTENKAKKFSHKLVEEAFSKKETLSLNEVADNTNIRESLILSNARAVLCAPIIVRDVPIACLYVSHEDVGTPFNSDEIKIATLLTALAGAALENAEGFKQLKLLNESLSLQSEELQKAKEKADLANKAKNEFLANMSHEIRTPLGVVLGFCELMAETTSSQERTHYAEIIHRNGVQLSSLIDDILDFSKIEAGYLKIYPSPTNVQQDLKDILKSFREQAEKKNLKLELSCSPLLPSTIFIDKQRLRQILMNLVFNAIKFTDKGHVRVIADWKTFEASRKPHLSIDVEDTGIGMSPETVKNLFQAFFQADSSSTRKYAGTGLGLVLSRRLAHAMGGDLVLTKTELDVGSTFTLSL